MGRTRFLSRPASETNHLGYDAAWLAHRHKIPRKEAAQLISQIGPDRAALDLAARQLRLAKATRPTALLMPRRESPTIAEARHTRARSLIVRLEAQDTRARARILLIQARQCLERLRSGR